MSVCLFEVPFHVVYFEAYFAPTSFKMTQKYTLSNSNVSSPQYSVVQAELNRELQLPKVVCRHGSNGMHSTKYTLVVAVDSMVVEGTAMKNVSIQLDIQFY